MPYSWYLSERWEQLSNWMRQAWASCQDRIAPLSVLLGLTAAIGLFSLVLESFSLFLVAVVQAFVVFQLRCGPSRSVSSPAAPIDSKLIDGLRRHMPQPGDVYRVGGRIATIAYRLIYRTAMCLLISLSAGLAVLSAFVLKQPDFWQWATLQSSGPPLGPVLVTGLVMLTVSLMTSWLASRWPLLPR